MKTWLKYGLIFAAIGLVIVLAFRLLTLSGIDFDGPGINPYMIAAIATGPAFILIIIAFLLLGCNPFMAEVGAPAYCGSEVLATVIILSSVFISYFLIGALVGFVIENVRSKK